MEVSVMYSEKNKKLYIINGYKFHLNKVLNNSIQRWACTKRMCKSYVKLNENSEIFFSILNHNHEKDYVNILIRQKVSNTLKRKALDDSCEKPCKILHREFRKEDIDSLTTADTMRIRKNIHYARSSMIPKLPTNLDELNLALTNLGEEPPVIMSPDSGINELQGLSLEEQEKQKEEWQQELNKVEEEIKTLREVLGSKVKASQELRRKLGYTVWQEISEDVSQSLRNVKESNVYQNVEDKFTQFGKAVVDAPIFNFSLPESSDMRTPTRNMVLKHCYQNVEGKVKQFGSAVTETPIYQKTESVVKTTAEKATTIFGGFGSGLTTKLGQIKNSESFRSFEEKVGSALENVKTKVASRSNSMQNFDEILEEETRLANEEKRSREEREAATK